MALEACVTTILCGLSSPVRAAVKSLIETQRAFLQAQVAVIEAQLLQYAIINAPITLTADLIEGIIDSARATVTIVPPSLIQDCADLGTFSLSLGVSIDQLLAPLEAKLRELDRLLSVAEELEALKDQINAMIDLFAELILALDACA